jgi:hypothetical protein
VDAENGTRPAYDGPMCAKRGRSSLTPIDKRGKPNRGYPRRLSIFAGITPRRAGASCGRTLSSRGRPSTRIAGAATGSSPWMLPTLNAACSVCNACFDVPCCGLAVKPGGEPDAAAPPSGWRKPPRAAGASCHGSTNRRATPS